MVGSYQFARRHPGNLGCDAACSNKYRLSGHAALRGLGRLSAIGDATGAGVPAGTVLAYSASWVRPGATSSFFSRWNDPNWVQSTMQGPLAQKWGIVVDSQSHSTSDYLPNFAGKASFVLQVHTVSDYSAPDDIRAIIDGEFYAATGQMPQSTIRIVQSVSPSIPAGVNPNATFPAQTAAAIAAAQAGYQDALQRGDTASASQFAAQIQQLQTGSSSPGTWLSNNWPLLALGLGAVVVAKEVL